MCSTNVNWWWWWWWWWHIVRSVLDLMVGVWISIKKWVFAQHSRPVGRKNVRLRTTVLASNRKDFRGVSRTDSYLEAVRRNMRRIHSNSDEDAVEEDSELLMDNALSATCRLSSNYLGFYPGGPHRHLAVCTVRLIPPNKPIHDRRICSPTRPVAPCPINVFYHQFPTIMLQLGARVYGLR